MLRSPARLPGVSSRFSKKICFKASCMGTPQHSLIVCSPWACCCAEFSQVTASCFQPLEQQAAKNRARNVAQAAAAVCGKQHYMCDRQQQEQQRLCQATQQGLRRWMQAAAAAGEADVWHALWGGSTADLEGMLGRAFAAGFGASLEESTLQHYVSTRHRCLLRVLSHGDRFA